GPSPAPPEPAPAAGAGRSGGLASPRADPRSVTAQHGSGGAVGAPMRRRTGRSLPDPCPAAPNRSGDGAPAPVHGRLGSRSWSNGEQTAQHTPLTARARLRESPPTARPTPVQGGPGRRRGSDAYAQRARHLRARLSESRAAGVRRRRDLRRRPRRDGGGKPAARVGARAGRARLRARALQAASVRVPAASLARAPEPARGAGPRLQRDGL